MCGVRDLHSHIAVHQFWKQAVAGFGKVLIFNLQYFYFLKTRRNIMPINIIHDCDPGHDDAVAMLLAIGNPKINLLGVTTVGGNQSWEV